MIFIWRTKKKDDSHFFHFYFAKIYWKGRERYISTSVLPLLIIKKSLMHNSHLVYSTLSSNSFTNWCFVKYFLLTWHFPIQIFFWLPYAKCMILEIRKNIIWLGKKDDHIQKKPSGTITNRICAISFAMWQPRNQKSQKWRLYSLISIKFYEVMQI